MDAKTCPYQPGHQFVLQVFGELRHVEVLDVVHTHTATQNRTVLITRRVGGGKIENYEMSELPLLVVASQAPEPAQKNVLAENVDKVVALIEQAASILEHTGRAVDDPVLARAEGILWDVKASLRVRNSAFRRTGRDFPPVME